MAGKQSGVFLGGMILGATVGTVAGLLIAPRTGRETRRILKKSADALPELVEDLSTTIHLQADRFSDTTLRNWEQTLGRLREAVVAGKAASEAEYEHLSRQPQPEESPSADD